MVIKENLETKVTEKCDVLVCGGGFAGISAALSAARQGKKVILLEKEYVLGGLGTAGLITIFLPLCDGLGRQVSFGIAEELLKLSVSLGAEDRYPENWLENKGNKGEKDKRFAVQYNPVIFEILAEQLLLENGVDILYGTVAVAVAKERDKISAVIVENKSGRQGISVGSVVDATGDCDIAHFAGAPTARFKEGNMLAAWYYSLGKNGYKLCPLGILDVGDPNDSPEDLKPLVAKRFSGLDGRELSLQAVLSHKNTLNDVLRKRKNDPQLVPTAIAAIPQTRMSRKIVGEYALDEAEAHTYFEDSIGLVPDWRKRGPVFEVPFRTLYSGKIKNLICAGRCTSVTDSMWDIMRVIPCCCVTGEAAGLAAAMTQDFTSLDVGLLQNKLSENGAVLHESDLSKAFKPEPVAVSHATF